MTAKLKQTIIDKILGMHEEGFSARQIAVELGIDNSVVSKYIKLADNEGAALDLSEPDSKLDLEEAQQAKMYVVTSVINNCDVNNTFAKSLLRFCKENEAQLLVKGIRYKNPNLFSKDDEYEVEWPTIFNPYYLNKDLHISDNLVILGSLSNQATSSRPIAGTLGMGAGKAVVIGHPRLAMDTIACAQDETPKEYMTTGSASMPIYSDSAAGRKAEFHHVTGALVIELEEDGTHYFRWIMAGSDGSILDLDKHYTPRATKKAPEADGLIVGDVHVGFHDPAVCKAVLGDLAGLIQPKKTIIHDLQDFFSGSHHHKKNLVLRAMKHARGRDDVHNELEAVAEWLSYYCAGLPGEVILVPSNHHDHLDKWLDEDSSHIDIKNAWIWHELNSRRLKTAIDLATIDPEGRDGADWDAPSALEHALDVMLGEWSRGKVKFHNPRTSLMINGIDCSNHGHRGVHGAKGSAASFARTLRKTIIGHFHFAKIVDGCFQIGMSCKRTLPYSTGYSSHSPSCAIIYANGARTIIPIKNGKFRR